MTDLHADCAHVRATPAVARSAISRTTRLHFALCLNASNAGLPHYTAHENDHRFRRPRDWLLHPLSPVGHRAARSFLPSCPRWYAATHFSMTTDINQLISSNSPGRQRELAFEKAFPQFDTIVAVVDAPTPELVEEATAALVARLAPQKNFFRIDRRAAGRRVLRPERPAVRAVEQLEPQMTLLYAGAAADAGAGRRSEPARRDSRAAIRAPRRAIRQAQARQHGLAADARGRHARPGERRQAGELFLARAGPGPRAETLRPDALPANSARCSIIPSCEPGLKASDAIRQAAADLNLASTYQARVRLTGPVPMNDDQFATIKENAGAQRGRHHCRRAVHPVAGAALVAGSSSRCSSAWPSGCRSPRRSALLMVGSLQPDIGLLRRAVRRSRRRFRPSVQRPLSGRTARSRRPARSAAACRPARRRAADAGGARHRRRLPVVPADGISRAVRARPDRRRRHADRVPHQHHLVAGAVEHAQAAQRAAAARLYVPGAGRRIPRAPSHADPHRDRTHHPRRVAAALLAAFRFQSDESAQPQNVESVATYLQLERDQAGGTNDIAALEPSLAAADAGGRQASGAAAGRAGNDAFDVHPDGSGQKTAADQECGRDA